MIQAIVKKGKVLTEEISAPPDLKRLVVYKENKQLHYSLHRD